MGLILRLILAGASRTSIIAKHGKKAYDAAKNLMKTKDKSIWSKLSKKDAEKYILKPIKKAEKVKLKPGKQILKDFGKGIAVGTTAASVNKTSPPFRYAKGGGVRKPKY
tara:strand:+ start:347 stop:673 length:327 start_codon:yes stop_codon:yes gene_type:complete